MGSGISSKTPVEKISITKQPALLGAQKPKVDSQLFLKEHIEFNPLVIRHHWIQIPNKLKFGSEVFMGIFTQAPILMTPFQLAETKVDDLGSSPLFRNHIVGFVKFFQTVADFAGKDEQKMVEVIRKVGKKHSGVSYHTPFSQEYFAVFIDNILYTLVKYLKPADKKEEKVMRDAWTGFLSYVVSEIRKAKSQNNWKLVAHRALKNKHATLMKKFSTAT